MAKDGEGERTDRRVEVYRAAPESLPVLKFIWRARLRDEIAKSPALQRYTVLRD